MGPTLTTCRSISIGRRNRGQTRRNAGRATRSHDRKSKPTTLDLTLSSSYSLFFFFHLLLLLLDLQLRIHLCSDSTCFFPFLPGTYLTHRLLCAFHSSLYSRLGHVLRNQDLNEKERVWLVSISASFDVRSFLDLDFVVRLIGSD